MEIHLKYTMFNGFTFFMYMFDVDKTKDTI